MVVLCTHKYISVGINDDLVGVLEKLRSLGSVLVMVQSFLEEREVQHIRICMQE